MWGCFMSMNNVPVRMDACTLDTISLTVSVGIPTSCEQNSLPKQRGTDSDDEQSRNQTQPRKKLFRQNVLRSEEGDEPHRKNSDGMCRGYGKAEKHGMFCRPPLTHQVRSNDGLP